LRQQRLGKRSRADGHLLTKRACPSCGKVKTFPKRNKYCSCACASAASRRQTRPKEKGKGQDRPGPTEEQIHEGPKWTINLNNTLISTKKQFIKHYQIDENVWYIEKFKLKTYQGFNVPRATRSSPDEKWLRPSTDPVITQLYSIEARMIPQEIRKLDPKTAEGQAEYLRQMREILKADNQFRFRKAPKIRRPAPLDRTHDEIAVAMVSDLHLSETVRSDDANGINVFNSVIAASRLWEHAQKIKTIVTLHRRLYEITKIWSPLLGDIVNGTIHPEFEVSNDLSSTAAVVLGARLMGMFYEELKALGLPIEVNAVHGNHARLTPKMPTKRQAHTNLDWQLYEILADHFRGDDQVGIDITTSQIGHKRLYDWNYRFEHGINVRSGKEEDFEDHTRALFDDPIYREATGYTGASFDQIVIGNMHKPKFLERTVVNGSYTGQNELGMSWRLKPIRAQQLMWGVSKSHVRTWEYQLDLTHIRDEDLDNPFAEYARWFLEKHS
jgi:hypothetical protein